jgi:ribose 5-phosphate isomerase A
MPEEHIYKMVKLVLSTVPKDGVIGLGSGSTVAAFIKALSETDAPKDLTVIPSSMQIEAKALEYGLRIGDPSQINKIEWTFDGADQIDRHLHLLKGGGGALLRERVLLSAAKRCVIMVDASKVVERLNRPVPIEVLPFARWYVKERVESLGGKAAFRADKKGYPFITENGNIILDVDFGEIAEPNTLHHKIKEIAGVVDTGLFALPSSVIYVAREDGSVYRLDKDSLR